MNKQERCELEKELSGTTTDLEQQSKENSEVCIEICFISQFSLLANIGTQCV